MKLRLRIDMAVTTAAAKTSTADPAKAFAGTKTSIASDASIRIFNAGMPHPRGYGTNARVLGKYVRDEKVISLEEAIRRMTSLPAQKFQLQNRGLLQQGNFADIVIFNEKEVIDMATFEKPHAYSRGFYYVLVNGTVTVDNGTHNGVRAGKAIHGPGYK